MCVCTLGHEWECQGADNIVSCDGINVTKNRETVSNNVSNGK